MVFADLEAFKQINTSNPLLLLLLLLLRHTVSLFFEVFCFSIPGQYADNFFLVTSNNTFPLAGWPVSSSSSWPSLDSSVLPLASLAPSSVSSASPLASSVLQHSKL